MNTNRLNRRALIKEMGVAGLTLAATTLAGEVSALAPPAPEHMNMPDMPNMPKHDMSGYGIPSGPPQQIAMLVYPKMTALDLIGPNQILAHLSNVNVHLVWKDRKVIVSDSGVPIQPTTTFADCPDDLTVLFAPGGSEGTIPLMNDPEVIGFLAKKGQKARYVTSVCTGALLIGAAGLLKGYRATTHWAFRDDTLPLLGATPVAERVVQDRNRITGAGVTAGIDFGLHLAAVLRNEKYAKALQLALEYDPQPPYHAGNPATCDVDVLAMSHAAFAPTQFQAHAAALQAQKRLAKIG